MKIRISFFITSICFAIIKTVNRYKDRCLSQRLFELAELYNTRPGEHLTTMSRRRNENQTFVEDFCMCDLGPPPRLGVRCPQRPDVRDVDVPIFTPGAKHS